jgi:hypothetical protein
MELGLKPEVPSIEQSRFWEAPWNEPAIVQQGGCQKILHVLSALVKQTSVNK